MDRTLAEEVVSYLQHAGIYATLNESYSGRGMFGTSTVAVETDSPPIQFGVALGIACDRIGADNCDESINLATRIRQDTLGHSKIYY